MIRVQHMGERPSEFDWRVEFVPGRGWYAIKPFSDGAVFGRYVYNRIIGVFSSEPEAWLYVWQEQL